MSHTKGPWSFLVYDRQCVAIVKNSDGDEVASVGMQCMPDAKADAHLIAAAPDMLEALEMFIHAEAVASTNAARSFGVYVDAMDMTRAAIKKARGEK